MATDLGKVGMRMRGDWSSSATYEVLDAVSYNSELYIAKQEVPANTVPTNTTYWQKALGFSSEDYSTSGITLEYDATGATNPSYTMNTTVTKIQRRGNVVTMVLQFSIADVGSGTKLNVKNLPIVPSLTRTPCQVFGPAAPSGAAGMIDQSTSRIIMLDSGGDTPSSRLGTGNLFVSSTFTI